MQLTRPFFLRYDTSDIEAKRRNLVKEAAGNMQERHYFMKWEKYTIETTTEAEDLISSMLADLGVEGVEIEDSVPLTAADTAKMFIDFLPELPPDNGKGRVSFYLEAGKDHRALLSQVRAELEAMRAWAEIGSGTITASETEDKDWINNWKEFFHAFTIEHPSKGERENTKDILIRPSWEECSGADADKIQIEIDPGLSFGTGHHETTQLCIRQLMAHLSSGDRVLDLGCGSGILSVVSIALGADHVTGTDVDEDCITSTHENFARNHIQEEQGTFYAGNLITDEVLREKVGNGYDIVVANILADVIIPMAPYAATALSPGGIFICSGIIDFKEDAVCEALKEAGLQIAAVTRQGEWVAVTARKPPAAGRI